MTQTLSVFVCGNRAGTLTQSDEGLRTFSYDPSYSGVPLSLSMPVRNRTYKGRAVDAYLLGLLPDDNRVRHEAGRRFGVSGNNPFALLTHMGLDCPGGVQICSAEEEELVHSEGKLVPLSEAQIAERLSPKSGRQEDTWLRMEERWSLGGNQSKFALRLMGNEWYECQGSAATTHILKPGIEGMRLEALDEYATMRIARACGIPCEELNYHEFCGVPAVVATRYDRVVSNDKVVRIHQEDICQALSIVPEKKYAEDGGPSTPDVLRVLSQTYDASESKASFAAMLFFNYLMGAPDAHAKNYSILHLAPRVCTIAPLYDVASGLPYDLSQGHPLRMAMSIGGENRLGHVGRAQIERFADIAHMDRDACLNLMANLCGRILREARPIMSAIVKEGAQGADELAERLVPAVETHCRRTLQAL